MQKDKIISDPTLSCDEANKMKKKKKKKALFSHLSVGPTRQ